MTETQVTPVSTFYRSVHLTGDKSVSHRALMFSALQPGKTRIYGLSEAADPMSTRSVLQSLGISIVKKENWWEVVSHGRRSFTASSEVLDVGNSGTTIRLMSGILAGQPFTSTLNGDASIQKRPMNRIIRPLQEMGADIHGTANGKTPIVIHGRALSGMDYRMEISSAQVKSCVLLAGLFASGKTIVREPVLSRDHTERMLNLKTWTEDGYYCAESSPSHEWEPADIHVPGDPSSAAFWLVAAAIVPDAVVTVSNILLNPTRTGFINALEAMGADISIEETGRIGSEPIGSVTCRSSRLKGIELGGTIIPSLIDEIPVLCIAAAMATGPTTISGAGELRVKECDRIAAMVTGLKAMGAQVTELTDGMRIEGGVPLKGTTIDSFHDHRIAMSFAIAGLVASSPTRILNADSVSISYPAFWNTYFNHSSKG
ncbi:MAG: 3-phosphoshikimate 1-carboxyvinyltransferase [Bacteroidetes bacterium]|nr:3-phosphoshikimate 1-carboxyvinyltransferase [Bacteroidota bacterium]